MGVTGGAGSRVAVASSEPNTVLDVTRPPPGSPAAEPVRVLVVDDEAPIVAVLVGALRQAGYEAVGCTDARRAADGQIGEFDVLVSDYRLPHIDGLELFARLRSRQPTLVGVLTTGFGNLPLVRQAMQRGFSAILLKPFPLERAQAAVERALGQRRLHEENCRLAAALDAHDASQRLSAAQTRGEVARETARLAAEAAGSSASAVLLAGGPQATLELPVTDPRGTVPGWARGLPGHSLPAVLGNGLPDPTCRTRLALPLRCGAEAAGLLVLERPGEPFARIELERLRLLADQAALVLVNLAATEARIRDEKLALVGRMAGAICERLRAPLRHIEAELVEVRSEEEEYLAMIRQEVCRLELMCSELSDFVDGGPPTRHQVTSLRGLLESVAARARLSADPAVAIEVEAEHEIERAIDERKLTRALANLAKNAIEAMPGGGRLSLRLRAEPGAAVIEVEDTGCGMPPEVQARVFEPFFTHGKSKGTGLGGAVVQSAVASHGGRIELRSEPGEGTCFRLWLPHA